MPTMSPRGGSSDRLLVSGARLARLGAQLWQVLGGSNTRPDLKPLPPRRPLRRRPILSSARANAAAAVGGLPSGGPGREPRRVAQRQAPRAMERDADQFRLSIIGGLPVAEIDTPLVLKVLEQKVKAERGYPAGTLWTAQRRQSRALVWAPRRSHAQRRCHPRDILTDRRADADGRS
jgi:hypothetical protein